MTPLRVAVVISGRGSNLRALHEQARPNTYEIVGVVSNKAEAPGLRYATAQGLATRVVDHRQYATAALFDAELGRTLDTFKPDIIALAGFLRILTTDFVTRYAGRLINIHPSLLPAFPGLNTHERALASGATEHGATVHWVTHILDSGPIIAQARLHVDAKEDAAHLGQRVLALEHRLYPQVLTEIAQGRIPWGSLVTNTAAPIDP